MHLPKLNCRRFAIQIAAEKAEGLILLSDTERIFSAYRAKSTENEERKEHVVVYEFLLE